jgi:outer membrane protein assembly factor BamB
MLHGIDPATGAVRWTTALPPAVYSYDGYPTVSGGIIYVHNQDDRVGGVVYAFDLATGKPAWASIVMQAYDTLGPVAGGGLVYVSGITNQLYALDPASGRQAYWVNSGADGGGTSSAVYAGGRLYVNDFPGGGQVFSAPTGAPAGAGMFATRRPSVDPAANVMVALQGNRITAESLTDRTRYWTVTDKSIPSLSPIIANGMVITGDNSGRLLVLDEATGTQVWSDAHAFAPTTVSVIEGTEPARLTVGAGGLAVTSGNQVRLYAGAVDNGPRTG